MVGGLSFVVIEDVWRRRGWTRLAVDSKLVALAREMGALRTPEGETP